MNTDQPERIWISQSKAAAIVARRLDYGLTWFKSNIRPMLEERGGVAVMDYKIAKTKNGKKYIRRGIRIDQNKLMIIIEEIQDSASIF